jgi:uncharacterized zinc-type alcohol dehydrogenase-like protein
MKTHAYLKNNPADQIHLEDIVIELTPTDLIIRSTHFGLSRGNVFVAEDKWNSTVYPHIGTSETVGIIEEVGQQTQGFSKGDTVAVGYILGACMNCDYCLAGLHQYCKQQINTELGGHGGMSQHIAIDYRLVTKVPSDMAPSQAATLSGYGLTAYSAIRKANIEPGKHIGIIGLGNLGAIATVIAKSMGMKVTVFSSSPDKETVARKCGAANFLSANIESNIKEIEKSFDLIITTSPGNIDLNSYLELLKPTGKFCFLGLPFEQQHFSASILADYASRSIYGSYVGSVHELTQLFELAVSKGIQIDVKEFNTSAINEAVEYVKNNNSHEKVILNW